MKTLKGYPCGEPRELIALLRGKMSQRLLRDLPEPGDGKYFADFGECGFLPETEFGNAVSIFIERDEDRPGKAFLGLAVLHPRVKMDISTYLKCGTKYELSDYLNSCDIEELLGVYRRLNGRLMKDDL